MRERCCANVEKEGNKDNNTMTGEMPDRGLGLFLLADRGGLVYLDRDVIRRSANELQNEKKTG